MRGRNHCCRSVRDGAEACRDCGANELVKADGNEVQRVLELTKGKGAEAVIDFVAERGTTSKGLAMTREMGSYYVVGYGEDINISTFEMVTTEKNIIGNLVGTWAELTELMSLADKGQVNLASKNTAWQMPTWLCRILTTAKSKAVRTSSLKKT